MSHDIKAFPSLIRTQAETLILIKEAGPRMKRVLARSYGLVSSLVFRGDVKVLKTIDSGSSSRAFCLSLLVHPDRQHSGMARPTQTSPFETYA